MIRVMIVDDHKSVLDAFSSVISTENDMELVGSSTSTKDIVKLCEELNPDVLLTDISIESNDSGIKVAEKISECFPEIKIMVMSGFDEISYIPGAKKAGASAFISKARPMNEFVDVIRAVARGEKRFPEPITIPTASGESPYTEREMEVLKLLCHSYSRNEIADEMGIAMGTVKRHIENILLKSGCKNAMELVVYVVGNGYIAAK